MTLSLRTRIRTLGMATLLAAAMTMPALQVHAEQKQPGDDGVRCAITDPETGHVEFYMPGEAITVRDSRGVGHIAYCGADGNWEVTRSLVRPALKQHLPLTVAVLMQP